MLRQAQHERFLLVISTPSPFAGAAPRLSLSKGGVRAQTFEETVLSLLFGGVAVR
jgi:hypothetical protein